MRSTAEILDDYRKKRKFTQDELAQKAEISRPHLGHILLGSKRPKEKTLYNLMDILEIEDNDRADILLYEDYLKAPTYFRERYDSMEKKLSQFEKLTEEVEEFKEFKETFSNWIIKKKS